MAKKQATPKRKGMVQINVRYPTDLLARASVAAEWEGLGFSDYARTALLRRVRATEAERAKEEGGK
jgi:hypothetical protein